jgi:hypothetical protein
MFISRKNDLIISSDYEDDIALHLKNVVEDLRSEWEILKQKETLEERNQRLLCELQCELEKLK